MTDGVLNMDTYHCIYTSQQSNPWVKINLERRVLIEYFKVYTMFNYWVRSTPAAQFRNVVVGVGSDVNDKSTICGKFKGPPVEGKVVKVFCNKETDKEAYIKMVTKSGGGHITLCELQVFGKGKIFHSLLYVVCSPEYFE